MSVMQLDLASLASIRSFCECFTREYGELYVLVNNAGVSVCPYMETEDGFEMQFGVNHLGHFALTNLLLLMMADTEAPCRIINVSSRASQRWMADLKMDDLNYTERSYSRYGAYCQSKLANVLFTKELHRKLQGTNVTTYAVHPGVCNTEFGRHANLLFRAFTALISPFVLKTPLQAAQTSVHCAVAEDVECHSGRYFVDCAVHETQYKSNDAKLARELWDRSEEMTGVKFLL